MTDRKSFNEYKSRFVQDLTRDPTKNLSNENILSMYSNLFSSTFAGIVRCTNSLIEIDAYAYGGGRGFRQEAGQYVLIKQAWQDAKIEVLTKSMIQQNATNSVIDKRIHDLEIEGIGQKKYLNTLDASIKEVISISNDVVRDVVQIGNQINDFEYDDKIESISRENGKLLNRIRVLETTQNDKIERIARDVSRNDKIELNSGDIHKLKIRIHELDISLDDKIESIISKNAKLTKRIHDLETSRDETPLYNHLIERIAALEELVKSITIQASSAIEELRDELKADTPQHEYIKSIQSVPIYDYVLIKAKRRLLHQEYMATFKFFQRLIKIRYEMPIAVAVMK